MRSRPKSEHKKLLVSVRYSQEVVAYFKSTGEGWQSRMDGVLREYVASHSNRA
nr:BrnA antitoxin family protein [uncultured Rhodoferax sp.]